MKKICILFLLSLTVLSSFGRDKIAVYVTGNNNSSENKLIASRLVAAIAKDGFYEVVERTDAFLAQIKKEQTYQQSGSVDDDQLSRLGKQFGVQKVCIVEVIPVARAFYISARIVDVESASVEATADVTCESVTNINALVVSANELASKLLNPDEIIEQMASRTIQNPINDDQPESEYALLHVFRQNTNIIGGIINYDLHLGEEVICRVSNNWNETIKITKEGLNILWAKTERKVELPIDIQFGKEYYVRCSIIRGIFIGRPKLELIDNQEGIVEFQAIQEKKK
jgi:hypothetical protein